MKAVKHMRVAAKAPTKDGTFEGEIFYNPPEGDSDGERIENFTNTPGTFPLDYQHLISMDPGSVLGTIKANEVGDGKTLAVRGKLNVGEKMADAVFERMELPDDDPMVLKELSVAYAYDPTKNTKDDNGVVVNHDAELLAISIVHAGAQKTMIKNVKAEMNVLDADLGSGLISVEKALEIAGDLGYPEDVARVMLQNVATYEGEKVAVTVDTEVVADALAEEMAMFEKAVTAKPWHISEREGKYCVIKNDTGEEVTCHDTRKEALDHIRALYANEAKTRNLGTHLQHLMAAPPKGHGMSQEEASMVTVVEHDALDHTQHAHEHPTKAASEETQNEKTQEEKAGRVIGAKRVSDLKSTIGTMIDDWASAVNGDLVADEKAGEPVVEEKAEGADEIADINARLSALLAE